MKIRSTYSNEFKIETANLVLNQGYSVQEAADAMNVGPTAVRRWAKQLEAETLGVTPENKAITAEQIRIQELEARIKKIEWENDILKKATALCMQDSIKR
jgi:transposase